MNTIELALLIALQIQFCNRLYCVYYFKMLNTHYLGKLGSAHETSRRVPVTSFLGCFLVVFWFSAPPLYNYSLHFKYFFLGSLPCPPPPLAVAAY